jgi:hypothetical protein
VCEAPAAAVRLQILSQTCNTLRLVFQTQPRSAKLGHYPILTEANEGNKETSSPSFASVKNRFPTVSGRLIEHQSLVRHSTVRQGRL